MSQLRQGNYPIERLAGEINRLLPGWHKSRPETALRICATCGLFCNISLEMLSGRSSLSMTRAQNADRMVAGRQWTSGRSKIRSLLGNSG